MSPSRYSRFVALVACPFCRELFAKEEQTTCPVCGVGLSDLRALPLSHDALAEGGATGAPEYEPLPWSDFGRGRGLLIAAACVGLVLFFLPWAVQRMPTDEVFTGYTIARKSGWAWGGPCAWMLLIPFALLRRSIMLMRTARAAVGFLAAMPGVAAVALLCNPPKPQKLILGLTLPLDFSWRWPIYATVAVSLAAVMVAFVFGGRVEDIRLHRGSGQGETLH